MKKETIISWIRNNWIILARVLTVYWAIDNIRFRYRDCSILPCIGKNCCEYHVAPVLFYFLSAVLIFYLLNKIEEKIKMKRER